MTTAPSKLALAKALALLAAFLAVLGFSAAVAGLPMSTRQLAIALLAAWLATALLGYGLVGGRRAAAAATLLAAIALLALARPQLLPGAEREGGRPEERPGYVAFRFYSSFTYESSGSGEITAVWVALPYPHIDFVAIDLASFSEGPAAKLLRGGKVAQNLDARLFDLGVGGVSPRIRVDVLKLSPGESVVVEGVFYVPAENAGKVSFIDNMELVHQYKPDEPPVTMAHIEFQLQSSIPTSFNSQLQRWNGTEWVTTEKWTRALPNTVIGGVRLFENSNA
ncbi:MAG: hypothetical protein QXP65_02505 [Candidatus Hadarchaeales archaeon]